MAVFGQGYCYAVSSRSVLSGHNAPRRASVKEDGNSCVLRGRAVRVEHMRCGGSADCLGITRLPMRFLEADYAAKFEDTSDLGELGACLSSMESVEPVDIP